jgi:hypothetical protein
MADLTAAQAAAKFRAAAKALHDDAPEVLAETALELVRQGFDESREPDGFPWADVLRGGKPLIDTGTMQGLWHVTHAGRGTFGIASGVTYSQYHQDGTTNADGSTRIVPRKMVPDDGSEMPRAWEDAFAADLDAILKGLFR